jgi:hypothetical protein
LLKKAHPAARLLAVAGQAVAAQDSARLLGQIRPARGRIGSGRAWQEQQEG